MIKEYFTDGLISLAILLSLFRTDLRGINNLINYPEVQDVILGQSVAYSPANFHNTINSPQLFNHQKHIDFDNEAFSAYYHNTLNNLTRFRLTHETEIDTFLVNVPLPPANLLINGGDHSENNGTASEGIPIATSPTLPLESANTFEPHVESPLPLPPPSSTSPSDNTSQEEENVTSAETATVSVDVTFLFSNPFPGCDLTKEDLDLIEVLWRQDADLGVGKEVYDQNLRLELEKERELKQLKQQEKEKAQAESRQREDRQRQENASRWLKENFKRDGETGEWVRLQNQSLNATTDLTNGTTQNFGDNESDDNFLTLAAALDYITENVDLGLLENLEETDQQAPNLATTSNTFSADHFLDASASQNFLEFAQPQQQPDNSQLLQQQQQQQMVAFNNNSSNNSYAHQLQQQNSLEEHWNGFVDYLNTGNVGPVENGGDAMVNSGLMASPEEHLRSAVALNSDLKALDERESYLFQNATLPVVTDGNVTNDFDTLHSMESLLEVPANMTSAPVPTQPSPLAMEVNATDPMDWDFMDLDLGGDLTNLENPAGVDDLDLQTVSDMFLNMESSSLANTDACELTDSSVSVAGSTPGQDLSDAFEHLEGAIGGANYSYPNDYATNLTDPLGKVSRFSESSNDSGFANQAGFSSSSSGSSYAGSPASANFEGHNGSTADNDTEIDPSKGSRASLMAWGHVAHNHTYNTPPGQTPREVKKYAPKAPSRKGPQNRDERRAMELKIPFSTTEIIDCPVDTFNEMLSKYKLTEPQLTLIRDIRRRGKNKVAAQNCRKRKVGVIMTLADEMMELQKMRDRLVAERVEMERETRRMKEKFGFMYANIFQSLRDEAGNPYDPNHYSLQQSSDGNVFLVPRNSTSGVGRSSLAPNGTSLSASPNSASTSPLPKDSPSSSSSSSDATAYSRNRRFVD